MTNAIEHPANLELDKVLRQLTNLLLTVKNSRFMCKLFYRSYNFCHDFFISMVHKRYFDNKTHKKHNDHAIFESKMVSYFQTVNYPDDVLSKVIDFQKRTATLAFQDVEKIIVRLYPFICDIIQLLLSMKTYINSSFFIS